MIKIEHYIENLLLTHDCVIVPELGGFVTQYEPAYRTESGTFYPPYRTISFNGALRMNDGLLVEAFMRSHDTIYTRALLMVKDECRRIKEAIHTTGSYHFEHIGTLKQNSDGYLVFTPESQGGIVAPEFYGLDAFAPAKLKPLAQPVEEPLAPLFTPATAEEETADRSKYYILKVRRSVVHYAAAAVVAAGLYLGFTMSPVVGTSHDGVMTAQTQLFSAPTIYADGFRTAPAEQKAEAPAKAAKETVAAEVTEAPAPVVEASAEEQQAAPAARFTIVLASDVKQSNGEMLIARLAKSGMEEAYFCSEGNMPRVLYGHYATQADATRALAGLRLQDKAFQKAWVMEVK